MIALTTLSLTLLLASTAAAPLEAYADPEFDRTVPEGEADQLLFDPADQSRQTATAFAPHSILRPSIHMEIDTNSLGRSLDLCVHATPKEVHGAEMTIRQPYTFSKDIWVRGLTFRHWPSRMHHMLAIVKAPPDRKKRWFQEHELYTLPVAGFPKDSGALIRKGDALIIESHYLRKLLVPEDAAFGLTFSTEAPLYSMWLTTLALDAKGDPGSVIGKDLEREFVMKKPKFLQASGAFKLNRDPKIDEGPNTCRDDLSDMQLVMLSTHGHAHASSIAVELELEGDTAKIQMGPSQITRTGLCGASFYTVQHKNRAIPLDKLKTISLSCNYDPNHSYMSNMAMGQTLRSEMCEVMVIFRRKVRLGKDNAPRMGASKWGLILNGRPSCLDAMPSTVKPLASLTQVPTSAPQHSSLHKQWTFKPANGGKALQCIRHA